MLVIQKSAKSVQRHLYEFFEKLRDGVSIPWVTPSAWSQARSKLRHTAFIEMNKVAVVESVYAESAQPLLWHGRRLLAIDGSTLRLPNRPEVFEHFGGQDAVNNNGPCGVRVPQARLSVLFDCLNDIGIDAIVGKFTQSEEELAYTHFDALCKGDIVLIDRGYPGYYFFAKLVAAGADFVARCPRRSFREAEALFQRNQDGACVTVTLKAPPVCLAKAKGEGLPLEMRVRFVAVRLSTGELEVLATTLLDKFLYRAPAFLAAYKLRWEIETYYHCLKSNHALENFSGLTVEAILQDVHSAVFLANLETVVTRDSQAAMPKAGDNGRKYQGKRIKI